MIQEIARKMVCGVLVFLAIVHFSGWAGAGDLTTFASFNGGDGSSPAASVIFDSQGNMYGTTRGDGANGGGTIWEIAKGTNTITTLASFPAPGGVSDYASSLVVDGHGNLYGTLTGTAQTSTAFELAKGSGAITPLASFNTSNGVFGTALDANGNLFGTTTGAGGDGSHSLGTVWEIVKGSGAATTLYSFTGTSGLAGSSPNGAYPFSGATLDANGNLYGTTTGGGANDQGTVYEIFKGSHAITTLASFGPGGGYEPVSGVTIDSHGNLFGTTVAGGPFGFGGDGEVWEIAKGSGTLTVLAYFNGVDGQNPMANLTVDAQGNIFGTTLNGGAYGHGTLFEIAAPILGGANTITLLGSFNSMYASGTGTYGGATIGADGNLYGTTNGGSSNDGTVWTYGIAPVPEPSSVVLLLAGIVTASGFYSIRRRGLEAPCVEVLLRNT